MPTIQYKNSKDERIPGVTTIIGQNLGWNKQQLMWWANQMGLDGKNHREVAQEAADAGTIAHEMIEYDIKGKDWFVDQTSDFLKKYKEIIDKAETCYINFLDWKKQVKFEVIHSEIHLVSEIYQYGATPDCIAEINGKLSLFDWKTGSGVYPDMLIQLAAYKQVWEENCSTIADVGAEELKTYCGDPLLGGFYLLRIGKEDASWHWHHWDTLPEAWECFKHLRKLHDFQKVLKKKV